jgi:phosphohistidine swiveling domain-containing protein
MNTTTLSGRVASVGRGVITGIARIVNSETDLERVQPGEIMIAPQTDITFAPTMQLCAGVVTELGGRFCHAAIFTREHHIPCLTDVADARSLIPDGALITLDPINNRIVIT